MVKDKVSLVTFPNPMVTSGFVPWEVFVLFSSSAVTVIDRLDPNKKIRVNSSVLTLRMSDSS